MCVLTPQDTKAQKTVLNFCLEDVNKVYRVGGVIGNGTYGKVRICCLKSDLSQKYAIKSLLRATCQLSSIESELEILRIIDHPNLLRLHELYRDEKYFHFVTEFLPGGELFSLIDKHGPLKESEASSIFLQVVMALKHLHDRDICHRDLKPENIMLTSRSGLNIKVIDFGLSKLHAH